MPSTWPFGALCYFWRGDMNKAGPIGVIVLSTFLVVSVACGGGKAADTPAPLPTSTPTLTALPTSIPTPTLPADTPIPTVPTGSTATEAPAGDLVAQGKALYLSPPPNVGPQALWCYQCHTIDGVSNGLVGPDHTQVGTWAATRKPGLSAEEYIRESITSPQVFVTEGVERAIPGLMTTAITEGLTDEQVDALVAFLLVQK